MPSKHPVKRKSHQKYIHEPQMPSGRPSRLAAGRQRSRLFAFAILIAILAGSVMLSEGERFLVREIEVIGNSTKSSSEVASISGVRLGMNIFSVDEEEIKRNFSVSNAVELKDIRIEMPDTVILEVRERSVCAAVSCVGVVLLVDMDGYVLHRMSSMPQNRTVPLVSGMDARISTNGRTIEAGTNGQLQVMSNVLSKIYEKGMQTHISEVNVSNVNSVYLMSVSGIQVFIGDDENLDIKFAWMRAMLDTLTAEGVMSGVVDVSGGNNAVYSAS